MDRYSIGEDLKTGSVLGVMLLATIFVAPALEQEGPTKNVDTLIQELKDDDYHVRMAVVDSLVNVGEPTVGPLMLALKDEDWRVREGVVCALGRLNDTRAVDPLILALKDENSSVRIAASSALWEINDTRAVGPLIQALKDPVYGVRLNAAGALGVNGGVKLSNYGGIKLTTYFKSFPLA